MKRTKNLTCYITTIFLFSLLVFGLFIFLLPNTQGTEVLNDADIEEIIKNQISNQNTTPQNIDEKILPIINNVAGFDLSKYQTNLKQSTTNLYVDHIPQQNIHYTLKTNQSKTDILCTYTNGNLRLLSILETQGTPSMTQQFNRTKIIEGTPVEVLDELKTAKNFLNNYAHHTNKALYNELAVMLNTIQTDHNTTKTSGNIKLQVTSIDDSVTYRFTYNIDGFEAPDKCVALRYKNGFLKYFADTWELYQIGSTNIAISEKQAIDIAIENAKAASWQMGSGDNVVSVKNFTIANGMLWETVFRSSLIAEQARNKDVLMLYPMYHVWVCLDKFYPGNVYGFNVYVWADTGEIAAIKERVCTLDAPKNSLATADDFVVEPTDSYTLDSEVKGSGVLSFWSVAFLAIFGIFLCTVLLWLLLVKKNGFKHRFKFYGLLLCFVISFSLLLLPISTVSASEPVRCATIWGSESSGADDPLLGGASYRKTQAEIAWQNQLAAYLEDYFNHNNYYASDLQGSVGSDKSQIVQQIYVNEHDYSHAAVVDFNHGVGNGGYGGGGPVEDDLYEWHFMFEDNHGTKGGTSTDPGPTLHEHGVYDYEIARNTTLGKTFFTFINTCLSAYIEDTMNDSAIPDPHFWNSSQGPIAGTDRVRGMPYAWTHRIVREQGYGFTTSQHMSSNGYADSDSGNFVYLGFTYGSAALDQSITGSSQEYYYWIQDFFYGALSLDISIIQALNFASQARFDNHDFDETDLYDGFYAQWPMFDGENWSEGTFPEGTLAVYGNGNIHLYQYLVDEYISATGSNYWTIVNPDYIEGYKDNQYTQIGAITSPPYVYSQAVITCTMTSTATGHIYLYGYTTIYSNVQVWVSYDNSNWYQVNSFTVPSGSADWIDVGAYAGDFNYIAIVIYPTGNLYVDTVLVIPPIT